MRGSVASKVLRVAGVLAHEPSKLPRYVAGQFRSPINAGLPWMAYGAIDFLDDWLQPDHEVFEFGSGGSTVFFALRAKSVLAVDHSDKWADRVYRKLGERQCHNAEILCRDLECERPEEIAATRYAAALAGDFDVIVVDADDHYGPAKRIRPTLFSLAERHVKPGGLIVLDDAWRYPGVRRANRAREVKTFRDIGPGRPGVTETDVYLY